MAAPYISRGDVAAALNSLIYSTREPEIGALRQLLVVDLLVNAPSMPASDEARSYALRDLLTTEISKALSDQRENFGLDAADERESADQARESIRQDRAIEHATLLLAWSCLFYRYVRADLGFTVEDLAESYAVEMRTISRYANYGIRELTRRLIGLEAHARREQRRRRLLAALPSTVAVNLVGRERLLDEIEQVLPTLSPCHILVTGMSGIGKTSFVQELLRRFIERDQLDQLVWIEKPESIQYVRERLTEELLHEGGALGLREYLQMYRVAIVIDSFRSLAEQESALGALLSDLSAGVVVLINSSSVAAEHFTLHFALPNISPEDARTLIYDMLRRNPTLELEANDLDRTVRDLAEQVGGNPLALRLAAQNWDVLNATRLQNNIHERLLNDLFVALDSGEQQIWGALALLSAPISLDTLVTIWSFDEKQVLAMARQPIIAIGADGMVSLVGSARDFLRVQYQTMPMLHDMFDHLLSRLNSVGAALDVVEQVLLTDFPTLSETQRIMWIKSYWRAGIGRGSWANWRVILESYLSVSDEADPELWIAFGICLRRLADWSAAQQVFYKVASECGRTGQFEVQARVFVEWSILSKYRGDFRQMRTLIDQAKRFAQRAHNDELLERLTLQEAQLLVEQGRGIEAYRILVALPESQRSLALQSESQLLLGNFELCRALAERSFALQDGNLTTEVSLYTILGRARQQQGDLEGAQRDLTHAVTLLERADDVFALARAKTNLAAILISLDRHLDAGTLLADAENIQKKIGDKVGLEVTRHNRNVLGGYIAR